MNDLLIGKEEPFSGAVLSNLQNLKRFVSYVAFCLCFTAATRLIPLMGTRKMSLFFCASFLFLKTAFGDRPHNLRPDAATVAGALPFVLLLLQA